MRHLKQAFWLIILLPVFLWFLAEPAVFQSPSFFSLRKVIIQLTGIATLCYMSVAMVLALRPRWPEAWLGGLDKMYRLHKWLGITVLLSAVIHWMWARGTKWAVDWGWIRLSAGNGRGQEKKWGWLEHQICGEQAGSDNGVAVFFHNQHCFAETAGEWAFYAVVVLIMLALLKRIPYHWFLKTHRLLAICYLALGFHATTLMKNSYWLSPVGWLVTVLLVFGSLTAVIAMLGKIGAGWQAPGKITALHYFPGVKALEVEAEVHNWPGHKPGQFVFVTTDVAEGAHPYTLASSWQQEHPEITFIAKELGDHTALLHTKLHLGQSIRIEGPYGCFTFEDDRHCQIWIGGGIGITPFIARMKYLASIGKTQNWSTEQRIALFHSTADVDEEALDKLAQDASSAHVQLHTLIDARDGYLTGERIRATVPGWRTASIWFCGPAGFGEALKKDFAAHGFPVERHFHQELFAMR